MLKNLQYFEEFIHGRKTLISLDSSLFSNVFSNEAQSIIYNTEYSMGFLLFKKNYVKSKKYIVLVIVV